MTKMQGKLEFMGSGSVLTEEGFFPHSIFVSKQQNRFTTQFISLLTYSTILNHHPLFFI